MSYAKKLDNALGASRALGRVTTVLGADAPPVAPAAPTTALTAPAEASTMKNFMARINAARSRDVKDGVGTLVGAVGGMYIGSRFDHKWLGLIGGASLGRNVPALMHPDDRKYATQNMISTGGGVAGALLAKKVFGGANLTAILGFLAGSIATGMVVYRDGK